MRVSNAQGRGSRGSGFYRNDKIARPQCRQSGGTRIGPLPLRSTGGKAALRLCRCAQGTVLVEWRQAASGPRHWASPPAGCPNLHTRRQPGRPVPRNSASLRLPRLLHIFTLERETRVTTIVDNLQDGGIFVPTRGRAADPQVGKPAKLVSAQSFSGFVAAIMFRFATLSGAQAGDGRIADSLTARAGNPGMDPA